MYLQWIDWAIFVGILAFMMSGVAMSTRHMKGVADFLAANRSAGRYVISVAQGMAGLGSITIVAIFEMNYQAGFAMTWWGFTMAIVVLIVTVSGWVVYRFRETRALTMAQFFEMRYSRNFRIFAGIVAFLAGIVNFGIFPAVGARFFIFFCGLPEQFTLFGYAFSTFFVSMVALLSIAIFFVFAGGQIAVIVTDFLQGCFVNIVFVILIVYFLRVFDFTVLFEALSQAPTNESKINPFNTGGVSDFNLPYFLIGVAITLYNTMSWQGTQGYNSSAKSAHEAKMASVLSNWRGIPQNVIMLLIPVAAFAVMHHPTYLKESTAVQELLSAIGSEPLQNQARVPLVLTQILPVGLMGAFAAVMLTAFISSHDTYMHSWGSILIQDVVMPIRQIVRGDDKPLSERTHINLLRVSILGVAAFILAFSYFYKPSDYILMFFAITGAIYAGGSGSVIIGGLYWKRGTTAGAWCGMVTGATLAVGSILLQHFWADLPGLHSIWDFFPSWHGFWEDKTKFPLNGQYCTAISMGLSVFLYVTVSLLTGRGKTFDMDALFHRGKYNTVGEHRIVDANVKTGFRLLGMNKEFTFGDKIIYLATYIWTFTWSIIFVVGTCYNLFISEASDEAWMKFWFIYIVINSVAAVIVVVWFTIGGVRDLRTMFATLATLTRNAADDGSVSHAQKREIQESAPKE